MVSTSGKFVSSGEQHEYTRALNSRYRSRTHDECLRNGHHGRGRTGSHADRMVGQDRRPHGVVKRRHLGSGMGSRSARSFEADLCSRECGRTERLAREPRRHGGHSTRRHRQGLHGGRGQPWLLHPGHGERVGYLQGVRLRSRTAASAGDQPAARVQDGDRGQARIGERCYRAGFGSQGSRREGSGRQGSSRQRRCREGSSRQDSSGSRRRREGSSRQGSSGCRRRREGSSRRRPQPPSRPPLHP